MEAVAFTLPDYRRQAETLAATGQTFFDQGWMPATSGSLSCRIDDDYLAITASGWHKGQLSRAAVLLVDMDGSPCEVGINPSSETLLHAEVYRHDTSNTHVFHTHSINATVLSRLAKGDELVIHGYQVQKAFPGIDTHEVALRIPVVENDQDVAALAKQFGRLLDDGLQVPGILIRGHGLYTWGKSTADAIRHIEAFEFLFECEVLERKLSAN